MSIRLLAPDVAALIAAGEVIGRPADAVKELVENAIDAIFARPGTGLPLGRVQVEVREGGALLIRVTDDGCGIAGDELALAVQRHATSKIESARDLAAVGTLGFRGEALASIAQVAHLNVVSKRADEPAGSFIALAGGAITSQGHRAWGGGTSVSVRNLFFNVPARRQFLRGAASETAYVAHLICQYALCYPEIQFTLETEGRVAFRAPGSGRVEDAIAAVYGVDALQQMAAVIPAEVALGEDAPGIAVSGYAGQPSLSHANRSHISLFVNRRWVQNRALVFAVVEAYHDLLPPGRHPVAVLNLTLPPGEVDVNVHPTKAEVRFARERAAFGQVQRAVRGALAASVPVRELAARPAPVTAFDSLEEQQELSFADPTHTAFSPGQAVAPEPASVGGRRLPLLRVIGQVGSAFVVAEGPSGLYLIDQHRAHERVLYDRLAREGRNNAVDRQLLLEPLPLELTPRQTALVESKLAALAQWGLQLEPFGERTYLLRAMPAFLKGSDPKATVLEIVDELAEEKAAGDWQERALISLACHGAVKAGQPLALEEMRQLIVQLEQSPLPQTCPHGAPTMVHLSQAQLEKEFLRR
ncbi:MAG: DNA mismatch repair endonuclease MutL [Chloroflexi bacterium]|nr:DNA mismatch repair endonuclease MutL [Chloroflexota bacterium]MCL5110298.1 DNA mismatch repair endonuclease MutL [Chloroflexota bacterium]